MSAGRGLQATTRSARETLSPGDELTDAVTGERYRVLDLLGQGGMGRVFVAEQIATGRKVAVKCNQPIDPTNAALVERARREGQFLKQLQRHPHIVPVLATGMRGDGVSWMVMPLLDGASVGGLLNVLRRIPLSWTLRIAQAVCSALSEAHRYAIHRDIKPENVFVTREGGIYVLDFGAGKFYSAGRLTTTGTTMGTIAYSSPEQLTDPDSLDARSDLFSVGVMVFEMLSGVHPFDVEGALQGNAIIIGNRIIREPPRPLAALAPELPRYMPEVVEKLLEKDRERRSRNAAEAERVFGAAVNELASRIGPLPGIARIFEVYDDVLLAEEAERLGVQDTEKSAAAKRSGPRTRWGTAPLASFVPPVAPAPSVAVEAPAAVDAVAIADAVRGGTEPIAKDDLAKAIVESGAGNEAAPSAAAPEAGAPFVEREEGVSPRARSGAEPDDEVQAYLRRKLDALALMEGDDTAETRGVLLVVLLDGEEHTTVRAGAAFALRSVGDEACIDVLRDLAESDPSVVLRRICEDVAVALSLRLGRPSMLPSLPEVVAPVVAPPEAEGADLPSLPEALSPWAALARPVGPTGIVRPADATAAREWSTRSLAILAVASTFVGAAVVFALLYFLLG